MLRRQREIEIGDRERERFIARNSFLIVRLVR